MNTPEELFEKYLDGSLSEMEERKLVRWLKESEANRDIFCDSVFFDSILAAASMEKTPSIAAIKQIGEKLGIESESRRLERNATIDKIRKHIADQEIPAAKLINFSEFETRVRIANFANAFLKIAAVFVFFVLAYLIYINASLSSVHRNVSEETAPELPDLVNSELLDSGRTTYNGTIFARTVINSENFTYISKFQATSTRDDNEDKKYGHN